jgi:hypothetical protein
MILIILLVLPFLDMVLNGSTTQECLYLIKNVKKDIWKGQEVQIMLKDDNPSFN